MQFIAKNMQRLFLLVLLTSLSTLVYAQDKGVVAPDEIPGTLVYIPYPVSIELDGKLDDWKGIPVQIMDKGPYKGPDKNQNQKVEFSVAADDKNLYVLMKSKDSKIITGKHEENFWNEDSMEVYLNFSGNLNPSSYSSKIMQITINPRNIDRNNISSNSISGINSRFSQAKTRTFRTSDGWGCEVAVPLKKGMAAHGNVIGIQFHANGASKDHRDSKLIWSKLDTDDLSYSNPALFGRGVFFKIGSTDIPIPEDLGKDMADTFKSEGAQGKEGKTLVWKDEFSYKGEPDQEFWGYDASDSGKWNEELQTYTSSRSNSFVKDGKLTIRALKKAGKWTSARLITRGKKEWKYGYFEIKAKLPAGTGTWPAIWMMPAKDSYGSWPNSGEIDIMEFVGFEDDKIHTSVHTQAFNHRIQTQRTRASKVENVTGEFHTYAIEWSPKGIFWYVDDEPFYYFLNEGNGANEWPFDKPFYLILNVAMGGIWGGMKGVDSSLDTADMVIDYVRVYQ